MSNEFTSDDISAALAALNRASVGAKIEQIKGAKGDPGVDGKDGAPGKDAPPVVIHIGRVVSTDGDPDARIRSVGNNIFWLDLALPRGSRGERGPMGLQSEVEGPVGPQGPAPSDEEILRAVRKVFASSRDSLIGPRGECGADGEVGPPGPIGLKGDTGEQGPRGEATIISEDDLKEIFVRVLSDSGVLSEAQARLVAVHAALKRAVYETDHRHITMVADVFRKVDSIVTGAPSTFRCP